MDWLVTITSVNKDGKMNVYECEALDEQGVARAILTYKPKRGYKMYECRVKFNETIFNPFWGSVR